MKIEEMLREYINERYGSVRAFAIQHDIAYTTVVSVLKRGVDNSSVTTIVRICDALDISPDELTEGRIVSKAHLFEIKEDRIDLDDFITSYKWSLTHNNVEYNGHTLTDQEINTLKTAIDISLEMIKQNTCS